MSKIQNFFLPEAKYIEGDLTTPASLKNIHSICELILEIFIRPMGLNINNMEKLKCTEIDIGKKYTNNECPPIELEKI